MNIALIGVIIFGLLATAVILWRRASKDSSGFEYEADLSFEQLFNIVKNSLADMVKEENFVGLTELEFANNLKRKQRISRALNKCVHGDKAAKAVVIDLICEILRDYVPDEESICKVIPFRSPFLDIYYRWEILLYKYKQLYDGNALPELIKRYELAQDRYHIEDKTKPTYVIRDLEVQQIWTDEDPQLAYNDMLVLTATWMFQEYKGFGKVDTINEMNINGFHFGAQGSILFNQSNSEIARNNRYTQSLNIYHKGCYIHLPFINFGTEEEMRRIVQLICRYNNPGPLTEKRGFIVNKMMDKSRVMAMCPPVAECWAVFVRKFNLPDASMMGLLKTSGIKNPSIVYDITKYLSMGLQTALYTGRMGSGKTTFIASEVYHYDPKHNVRVVEMTPELHLRELYPQRNIFSASQTIHVTLTQIQDTFKKSDGAIMMIGELATAEITGNFIQSCQVASLMGRGTHHATTPESLVFALRNDLVNAFGYDMQTAETQVLQVLPWNVHLDYDVGGRRYVARITEIIPLAELDDYPEINDKDYMKSFVHIFRKFAYNTTDRKRFICRDIMVYNPRTDAYETRNLPSNGRIQAILKNLSDAEKRRFINFIQTNWSHCFDGKGSAK